jgi:hypothetical protein
LPFKLGCRPTRLIVKLKLKDFVDLSKLPTPPKKFGHENLIDPNVGPLGNDQYGCCVFAGAANEELMWCAEGETCTARFDPQVVLAAYAAVTGFNPDDPSTDQGTDPVAAAKWRQQTGFTDADGNVHKIEAYLEIDQDDIAMIRIATWLFGAVGCGIQFPGSAMLQFQKGKPWTVVKGSAIEGGHYIPIVGDDGTDLLCRTWGQNQRVAKSFLKKECMTALVYLTPEAINRQTQRSPEGFAYEELKQELKRLQGG